MEILLKSNDHVYIDGLKYLTSHGIIFYTMDEEMSVMEGNITAIPQEYWLKNLKYLKQTNY